MPTLRSGTTLDPKPKNADTAAGPSGALVAEIVALRAALEALTAKVALMEAAQVGRPAGPPGDQPQASTSGQLRHMAEAIAQQPVAERFMAVLRVDQPNRLPTAIVRGRGRSASPFSGSEPALRTTIERLGEAVKQTLQSYEERDKLGSFTICSLPTKGGMHANKYVINFTGPFGSQVLIAAAQRLRERFAVVSMPFFTKFGCWLRRQRQPVFKQLMDEGCRPRWRGVDILYTKEGRSQQYQF